MWPGQRAVGRRERLGRHGADLRIIGRRRLPAAGEHQVRALAVVVFAGVDAADQAQVVHLLGGLRQQLRDVDAGHGGGNRAERPAGVGARLGVPAFELAQAAVHVEHDDPLLIGLQLVGNRRIGKHAEPAGASRRRRPRPSCPGTAAERFVCSVDLQA